MYTDNNEIKHQEAYQLNSFLDTLSYSERVEFVSHVVRETGIRRQTFFNWRNMSCRIPEMAKKVIESLAGERIFVDVVPNMITAKP